MLFNSDIFTLLFLPAFLILFASISRFGSIFINIFVAAASLVFYANGDISTIWVILGSIAVNYAVAWWIARRQSKRLAVTLGVAFNLGLLFYFKYACFALATLPWTATMTCQVTLPLGISFFTFQQIAFIVDFYRGTARIPMPSLPGYAAFATFFPHLIAGPITRWNELLEPIERKAYSITVRNIEIGLFVFTIGLIKKIFLADPMAAIANPMFEASKAGLVDPLTSILGALAFSLQIYFDFSGYSDMAVGLALMVGIMLPWNFARPYAATSIIDFWRRWHITLSSFLRDYVYISLGGNRKGRRRRYLNLFITMLLGGLWHGAAWTFVAWGALHGAYLAINHYARECGFSARFPALAGFALVNLLVVIAWVFFRAETFESARNVLVSAASLNPLDISAYNYRSVVQSWPLPEQALGAITRNAKISTLAVIIAIVAGYAAAIVIDTQGLRERFSAMDSYRTLPWRAISMATSAAVVAYGLYMQSSNVVSFIYFNF